MRDLMLNKYLGFVSTLVSLILGITLYAYNTDQGQIDNKVESEIINRKNQDIQLRHDFKQDFINHEKLHLEQDKNSILLIKYLDQRFDDMEKLINSKK